MFSGRFDLFRNDSMLSNLGELTTNKLQSEIANHVPSSMLDNLEDTYRVSNVRYKPHQKLVIGLASGRNNKPIGIRIFPQSKLVKRFEAAQAIHPRHTFLLPEISGIAWVFPSERKLNLTVLDNKELLDQLVYTQRGCRLHSMEMVHYVPEHSYTAKVILADEENRSKEEYLKVFYNDRGATTADIMEEIRKKSTKFDFVIPHVTYYSAEHKLLMQSALQRDVSKVLSLGQAASSIAQFHQLEISNDGAYRAAQQPSIDVLLGTVEVGAPDLIPAIIRFSRYLIKLQNQKLPSPTVLLHGDPHLGNIFPLTNGKTGFIDLDGVHWGNAEADLASFFAFKLWCAMRDGNNLSTLLGDYLDFIDAYNSKTDKPVSVANAWLGLAEKLVFERIIRGISRGKVTHPLELKSFLDLANTCLKKAEQAVDRPVRVA